VINTETVDMTFDLKHFSFWLRVAIQKCFCTHISL